MMQEETMRYLASFLIDHQDDFFIMDKWHEMSLDYNRLLQVIKEFNETLL